MSEAAISVSAFLKSKYKELQDYGPKEKEESMFPINFLDPFFNSVFLNDENSQMSDLYLLAQNIPDIDKTMVTYYINKIHSQFDFTFFSLYIHVFAIRQFLRAKQDQRVNKEILAIVDMIDFLKSNENGYTDFWVFYFTDIYQYIDIDQELINTLKNHAYVLQVLQLHSSIIIKRAINHGFDTQKIFNFFMSFEINYITKHSLLQIINRSFDAHEFVENLAKDEMFLLNVASLSEFSEALFSQEAFFDKTYFFSLVKEFLKLCEENQPGKCSQIIPFLSKFELDIQLFNFISLNAGQTIDDTMFKLICSFIDTQEMTKSQELLMKITFDDMNNIIHPQFLEKHINKITEDPEFYLNIFSQSINNCIIASDNGFDKFLVDNLNDENEDIVFNLLAIITQYSSSIGTARSLFNLLTPEKLKKLNPNYHRMLNRLTKLLSMPCDKYIALSTFASKVEIYNMSWDALENGCTFVLVVFIEPSTGEDQIPLLTFTGTNFSFAFSIFRGKLAIISGEQIDVFLNVETGKKTFISLNMKRNNQTIDVNCFYNGQTSKTVTFKNIDDDFSVFYGFYPSKLFKPPKGYLFRTAIFPYDKYNVYSESWINSHSRHSSTAILSVAFDDFDELSADVKMNNLMNFEFIPNSYFTRRSLSDIVGFKLTPAVLIPFVAFSALDNSSQALIESIKLLEAACRSVAAQKQFVKQHCADMLIHVLLQIPDSYLDIPFVNAYIDFIKVMTDPEAQEAALQVIKNIGVLKLMLPNVQKEVFHFFKQSEIEINKKSLVRMMVEIPDCVDVFVDILQSSFDMDVIKGIASYAQNTKDKKIIKSLLGALYKLIDRDDANGNINECLFPLHDISKYGDEDIVIEFIKLILVSHKRKLLQDISAMEFLLAMDYTRVSTHSFVQKLIGVCSYGTSVIPVAVNIAADTGIESVKMLINSDINFGQRAQWLVMIIDRVPFEMQQVAFAHMMECPDIESIFAMLEVLNVDPEIIMHFLSIYVVKAIENVSTYKERIPSLLKIAFRYILFSNSGYRVDGMSRPVMYSIFINNEGIWHDAGIAYNIIVLFGKCPDFSLIEYYALTCIFLMRSMPEEVRSQIVGVASLDFNAEIRKYANPLVYYGNRFKIDLSFLRATNPTFETLEIFASLKQPYLPIQESEKKLTNTEVLVNQARETIRQNKNSLSLESFSSDLLEEATKINIRKEIWTVAWHEMTLPHRIWAKARFPIPPFQGYYNLEKFISPNGMQIRMKPNNHYTSHSEASLKRDSGKNIEARRRLEEEKKLYSQYEQELASINPAVCIIPVTNGQINSLKYIKIPRLSGTVFKPTVLNVPCCHIRQKGQRDGIFQMNSTIVLITTGTKSIAFRLCDVISIKERTHFHHPNSIEFFLNDGSGYFICFKKENSSDIYKVIQPYVKLPPLGHFASPLQSHINEQILSRWLRGRVTNYEYLLHINDVSGRSPRDTPQYPIMPWVHSNYSAKTIQEAGLRNLSLPLGAINEERLTFLKARASAMEPPHLYGSTHMSAPTVFLSQIRMEPAASLHIQFQSGQFDRSSRIFWSIAQNYDISINQRNDFFEVTPEFFSFPEFLQNANKFDLGPNIDDVVLPAWCNSPDEFIYYHRKVLESPQVTEAIHNWIDLVWGYKQTGEAAVAADNVYLPYLYADVWTAHPEMEESQIEIMLKHVGQIPPQLFSEKHPQRIYKEVIPRAVVFESGVKNTSKIAMCIKDNSMQALVATTTGTVYKLIGSQSGLSVSEEAHFSPQSIWSNAIPYAIANAPIDSRKFELCSLTENRILKSGACFGRIKKISIDSRHCAVLTDDGCVQAFRLSNIEEPLFSVYGPYHECAVSDIFGLVVAAGENHIDFISLRTGRITQTVSDKIAKQLVITKTMGYVIAINGVDVTLLSVNGRHLKDTQIQSPILIISPFEKGGLDYCVAVLENGCMVVFDVFILRLHTILDRTPVGFVDVRYCGHINSFIGCSPDGQIMTAPFVYPENL